MNLTQSTNQIHKLVDNIIEHKLSSIFGTDSKQLSHQWNQTQSKIREIETDMSYMKNAMDRQEDVLLGVSSSQNDMKDILERMALNMNIGVNDENHSHKEHQRNSRSFIRHKPNMTRINHNNNDRVINNPPGLDPRQANFIMPDRSAYYFEKGLTQADNRSYSNRTVRQNQRANIRRSSSRNTNDIRYFSNSGSEHSFNSEQFFQ